MSLTVLGRTLLRRPVLSSALAATSSTEAGSLLVDTLNSPATTSFGSDFKSHVDVSGLGLGPSSESRLGERLLQGLGSKHDVSLLSASLVQPSLKPFAAQAWPHDAAAPALFQLPHGHAFVSLGAVEPQGASIGSNVVLQALCCIANVPLSAPAGSDAAGGEVMQCISTKTWRRLKMKKHKIRKRRRLVRHQGKK